MFRFENDEPKSLLCLGQKKKKTQKYRVLFKQKAISCWFPMALRVNMNHGHRCLSICNCHCHLDCYPCQKTAHQNALSQPRFGNFLYLSPFLVKTIEMQQFVNKARPFTLYYINVKHQQIE